MSDLCHIMSDLCHLMSDYFGKHNRYSFVNNVNTVNNVYLVNTIMLKAKEYTIWTTRQ